MKTAVTILSKIHLIKTIGNIKDCVSNNKMSIIQCHMYQSTSQLYYSDLNFSV